MLSIYLSLHSTNLRGSWGIGVLRGMGEQITNSMPLLILVPSTDDRQTAE